MDDDVIPWRDSNHPGKANLVAIDHACLKTASPEIQREPFGPYLKCAAGKCECKRTERS